MHSHAGAWEREVRQSGVTIPVDPEIARAYHAASQGDRKKIQLLLGLRLRELATLPTDSLAEIMDNMGTRAEARGLTPEILEELLRE